MGKRKSISKVNLEAAAEVKTLNEIKIEEEMAPALLKESEDHSPEVHSNKAHNRKNKKKLKKLANNESAELSINGESNFSIELDLQKLKNTLVAEDQFITQVLKNVPRSFSESDKETGVNANLKRKLEKTDADEPPAKIQNGGDAQSRASNPDELRERLAEKLAQFKGKKLGFTEQKARKKLKKKLDKLEKKKLQKEKQKSKMKIAKLAQVTKSASEESINSQVAPKPTKPVFNSEGRMVFSKFDFGDSAAQPLSKPKKVTKDPKALLGKLSKEKEKLQKLEKSGKADVAQEIADKRAWENALKRTEGIKVKDNPELLAKSVKRKENKKKQSKKKWAERVETLQKSQEQRQKKRQENLKKKKTEKKDKKLKRLEKKGKIIKGV